MNRRQRARRWLVVIRDVATLLNNAGIAIANLQSSLFTLASELSDLIDNYNERLTMLEIAVFHGHNATFIPVPNGWSAEQAWEATKRGEAIPTHGSERQVCVLSDRQGNLLKVLG